MPELDWSRCPAVESVPGRVGGAWVFRDTRLPVATVLENLEDLSIEEVMEQFDVETDSDGSGSFGPWSPGDRSPPVLRRSAGRHWSADPTLSFAP